MMNDVVTPHGLDVLLFITSVPFLIVAFALTIRSLRSYRRAGIGHERRRNVRVDALTHLLAASALLAIAIAFVTRPLADMNPDALGWVERLVGPGAQTVGWIIASVLLWHEVKT